jgi:hypothetical protein
VVGFAFIAGRDLMVSQCPKANRLVNHPPGVPPAIVPNQGLGLGGRWAVVFFCAKLFRRSFASTVLALIYSRSVTKPIGQIRIFPDKPHEPKNQTALLP